MIAVCFVFFVVWFAIRENVVGIRLLVKPEGEES
jgi:hypothetical protein